MLKALDTAFRFAAGPKTVTHERRDLFRRPLTAPELKKYDGPVFDPPRAGARSFNSDRRRLSVEERYAHRPIPLVTACRGCHAAGEAKTPTPERFVFKRLHLKANLSDSVPVARSSRPIRFPAPFGHPARTRPMRPQARPVSIDGSSWDARRTDRPILSPSARLSALPTRPWM